jgi:hypothetical protein
MVARKTRRPMPYTHTQTGKQQGSRLNPPIKGDPTGQPAAVNLAANQLHVIKHLRVLTTEGVGQKAEESGK